MDTVLKSLVQLLLITGWINYSQSQLNYCLKSVGCYDDECCFNIIPKTGPVCDPIPGCAAYFQPECCRNARPVHTDYGIMYGYAISLDSEYGYQENARSYLQIWKGIPYARPPTRENNLRFRRPVQPALSTEKYDATHFRSACSQPSLSPRNEEASNISEDCLYLNIYNLKVSDTSTTTNFINGNQKRYPIIVFFDGVDHLTGSANRYPGHALAQLGLVVVTVNYRLGPFGYLSNKVQSQEGEYKDDNDEILLGNYGLWDQVRALEFIREHAEKFLGDPNQITVVGHGSAAADIALHLLSEKSGRRGPPLFHRAILMSGSDQMEGGFVQNIDESEEYAKQFAYQVGCDTSSRRSMINCLRSRTAVELSNSASQTRVHRPNWLTKPWAPNLDYDFIQDMPSYLWKNGHYAHIPVIAGLVVDDGVFHALASIYQIGSPSDWNFISQTNRLDTDSNLPNPNVEFSGMSVDLMRAGFMEMVKRDFSLDPVGMTDALCFYYTYWPDKDNSMIRWEMYHSAWTDRFIGSGVIETLRYHSHPKFAEKKFDPVNNQYLPVNRTQMYVFGYRSDSDVWARIIGAYPGSELQYMFGLPLLVLYKSQESVKEEWPTDLGLKPPRYAYNEVDVKMAGYMLSFISNFAKSSNATPQSIRNLTWDTFRIENATYLWLNLTLNNTLSESHRPDLEIQGIGAGFDLRQNYKFNSYAYWRHFYPKQLLWLPRFSLPTPLPIDLEDYRLASFFLADVM
uniref:Carboxylesterase type B domain-containing protein n=1 Tax=Trichobilharzia regenti TaxID=157069 RepID=A0AA85IZN7_TRIRE|nr:unnamed protein product [Trichobilharzia regenti]